VRRGLLILVLVVVALAACGGGAGEGDDDEGGAEGTEVGELDPPPDPLETLAEPTPGQGVGVIGIQELSFTVTACTDGPAPGDTPEATLEYRVEGEGDSSDGPFRVEITRFSSDTGVGEPVLTETARISYGVDEEARGVEAQRTTAGDAGAWLDLADPAATTPLVERKGDAFDVRGTFGPEGARAGDEGLEDGRLRARCPA
jgi:hypothetical protein